MKRILFFLIVFFIVNISEAQKCEELPKYFSNYEEAVYKVNKAIFKFKDVVDCSESSWLSKATYHSCDGMTGFFIIYLSNGKNYIHKDLPINEWQKFKKSDSHGSYYSSHIRGKYRLYLNN